MHLNNVTSCESPQTIPFAKTLKGNSHVYLLMIYFTVEQMKAVHFCDE